MAGRRGHAGLGALAGLVTYGLLKHLLKEKWTFTGALTSAAAGMAVACLPDTLEPAVHSHHRRFFHSVVALGGIAFANKAVWKSPNVSPKLKMCLAKLYRSHLPNLHIKPFAERQLCPLQQNLLQNKFQP